MRQSQLFTKTLRENPKDEISINAQLLERAGFVYKNSAGVYTYLPLGWRVIQKIAAIIREEMNAIAGQELFMPALHDKKYLTATGRWDVDVVFKVISGKDDKPGFNISWTHEEIATEIATKYINSYKELPFSFYQIQTKFRNEPRAKSGLLRGREFMMKDLYSFHANEEDLQNFYEKVKNSYHKIFRRCGLKSICTLAGGGEFTAQNTHEFQVTSPVGEDTIYVCQKCEYAENKEIAKVKDGDSCPECGGKIKEEKAIEVGNIFPLGTKYSEAFNLKYLNEKGEQKYIVMGSYGIGLGRVMGTIVEISHDDKGIIWPESVAPFSAHLIALGETKTKRQASSLGAEPRTVPRSGSGAREQADALYEKLIADGVEVLYDDRDASAGEKFNDADLIGIPLRLVISEKTLKDDSVEIKKRDEKETKLVKIPKITKNTLSS